MNMQNLMAQAQKMQRDIQNKKNELDKMEFVGKSEWVEIIIDGSKNLKNIKITKEFPIDEDGKEILEDMISIAINDAYAKINEETTKKLGQYANALNGFM